MSEPAQQSASDSRSPETADAAISDQRLLRGARARRTIARHAVDVASLDGLSGLSLGRLATDLNLSKSGIQALFGAKENLQLAAVESAREQFIDAVVRPAQAAAQGAARLRALVEQWIIYAETPLFPGGCFWAANLADFDSRPGKVQDALFQQHHDWVTLLADELRHAAAAGEITSLDADLAAFQIDAALMATNTALRLGDHTAADKARRITEELLTPRR